MKKTILIYLVAAMIGGIGYFAYQKTLGSHSQIINILPQNTSLYVQFSDVEKNLKELASMPFWQGISKIDLDALMEKNAIDSQQSVMIHLLKDQLSEVINNPLAKRFFGNDVAIAMYSFDKDIGVIAQDLKILNPQFVEEILSGLFLVTRVDADVQFAEFVSRFFSQFGSSISQGQFEYKGKNIRTITLSETGIKFGIVRFNDLMVIGIGEKAARLSVDVVKGDIPPLSKDPQFAKAQDQFLKPSGVTVFLNFTKLISILKNQGDKFVSLGGGADLQAQWAKVMAKMNGLKAFAFSSQLTPLVRVDSRLMFDPAQLDADYAALYTCPPSENKTIDFTPQEVLGYYWSNCLKLDYYWDQIVEELKRTDAPSSKIDEFEAKIGLSVEGDILPAFGDEIGGYIQDIQIGGLIPIPKILLFTEVGNKAKAEKLLKKAEEQPFIMLQEENYNGVPIRFLAMSLGQDIQPAYAFLGDHLLISTSRKLIKDSIDTSQNKSVSLKDNPDFKAIDVGLTDKNRSVQFIKLGQVIEKTKGIIGWSNQWMTSRDKKADAFKAGSARPLEEVKIVLAMKEGELEEIRERLIVVEDEVWNLETKGVDASIQKAEMVDLQKQLDSKKEEIVMENERKEGLANVVGDLDNGSSDSDLRQFYLDEVVYPILDGLKSIQSFGLRSTVNGDAFEASLLLKIAN